MQNPGQTRVLMQNAAQLRILVKNTTQVRVLMQIMGLPQNYGSELGGGASKGMSMWG